MKMSGHQENPSVTSVILIFPVIHRRFSGLHLAQITVEIRFKEAILNDPVFLKFTQRVISCDLCRDASGIFQDFPVVCLQENIKTLRPVFHRHGDMTTGAVFRKIEIR